MKQVVILMGFAAVLSGCVQPPVKRLSDNAKPEMKSEMTQPPVSKLGKVTAIEIEEFFPLQQSGGALILDVRKSYAYHIDRIPGAISFPHNEYDKQVQAKDLEIQKALSAGKKVVVYCYHARCSEAKNVANKLAARNYDVRVFYAGIDIWRVAGLPLEAGVATE